MLRHTNPNGRRRASERESERYHPCSKTENRLSSDQLGSDVATTTHLRPFLATFSQVAFVDNSGSTSGELLKTLRQFTLDLGARKCALWNSCCDKLAETATVRWCSTGGTCPTQIYVGPERYEHIPAEWTAFTLLTDGQVSSSEYERLGQHAHKTSHLPTILGIALPDSQAGQSDNSVAPFLPRICSRALVGCFGPPSKAGRGSPSATSRCCALLLLTRVLLMTSSHSAGPDQAGFPISRCNVSVLSSHFTAARDALFVVFTSSGGMPSDISAPRTLTVRVLAAKGQWSNAFGGGVALPDLSTAVSLDEFPTCTMEEIRELRAQIFEPQPANTVLVDNGAQWLHVDQLLSITNPAEVVGQVSEADMEAIVRSFHGNGRLGELRRWLNDMTAAYALQADQAVRSATTASAAAGTSGMRQTLARLRHARNESERQQLRAVLFGTAGLKAEAAADTKDSVKAEFKAGRKLISMGLQVACALEEAGMGADMLGRLSNRAKRSKKISRDQLTPISQLDATGAPAAECNVMLETGPVALLVRRVDDELAEENTSDFGIDFALSVGCTARNDVWCPDVLGIADGVADRIEEQQQSVLTRDDTVIAIPMVSLADSAGTNKEELFKRLCLAFMGGLGMPSVWLVTLAAVEHTLATKDWAAPGTELGNVLSYFGNQIMEHIILPKGRCCPHDTLFNPRCSTPPCPMQPRSSCKVDAAC